MFQIHLNKKGMSGRAVRYEVLATSDVEAAEISAAHYVTKDSTMGEYNNAVTRLGMQMMIKSVTEPVKAEDLPTAKFLPMNVQELALSWNKYFNPKDTATLKALYNREHTVTQSDIDEIMDSKIALVD